MVKLPKVATSAPLGGLLVLVRVAPPVNSIVGLTEASKVKPLGKGSEILTSLASDKLAALLTVIVYVACPGLIIGPGVEVVLVIVNSGSKHSAPELTPLILLILEVVPLEPAVAPKGSRGSLV